MMHVIPANLYIASSLRRKHFIGLLLIQLQHPVSQPLFVFNILLFCLSYAGQKKNQQL